MSPADDVRELADAYARKVDAELAAADREAPGSDVVPSSGDPYAVVMLVKGDPGPAEVAGGAALSGPDGEAARKALLALGFEEDEVFATVARPEAGIDPAALARRLRLQVEAVDPFAVVALDGVAAEILAAAFGLARVPFGREIRTLGRVLVAVDGLEASLGDPPAKQRVWQHFQALGPREPAL